MADQRVWTVGEALDWTRSYLESKGDPKSRLSAEWLLSHATGLSRIELYAFFDRPLSPEERATLRAGVARRAEGEPLQYVSGEVAFRHLVLKVGSGVLIPRPETEVLVDLALASIADTDAPRVLDVGTGSGAIGLSIVREHPSATVVATDISQAAADQASANAERLSLAERAEIRVGDLFDPIDPAEYGSFDVVVSNPPYVPSAEVAALDREVAGFEPHLALDGGQDGLDIFRRMVATAHELLRPGGVFLVELHESNAPQARALAVELNVYGEVSVLADLAGRHRFVRCVRPVG